MRLRQQLAVLSTAAAATACSSLPTTPLRDFNSLSVNEQTSFSVCTIDRMSDMPASRVDETLQKTATSDPKLTEVLKDPLWGNMLRVLAAAELGREDCAREIRVNPATLPPLQMNIKLQ